MSEPLSKRKIVAQVRHKLVLLFDNFKFQDRQRFEKALGFAEDIHEDEFRRACIPSPKRGLPYIVHPMRVAMIILDELELKEPVAIMGALLHDVVESKRDKVSVSELERDFGRSVAMIVSVLTAPPEAENETADQRRSRKNIYYQRIRQASVVSKIVKLADRLDSMREAPIWLDNALKAAYLEETEKVYVPIAEDTDSYLHEQLLDACQELKLAIENPPELEKGPEDYFPSKK